MDLFFPCPHCGVQVSVLNSEINCGIFRHAVFKNLKPVDPHASRKFLEELQRKNEVIGCCNPFRLSIIDGVVIVEKCDYI